MRYFLAVLMLNGCAHTEPLLQDAIAVQAQRDAAKQLDRDTKDSLHADRLSKQLQH